MVTWHCQLGAAGNHFLIPVSFPACHRVYVPTGFHHLARACGQFNIQHGKKCVDQGQAVPTPAPPALGGWGKLGFRAGAVDRSLGPGEIQ